MDHKALQKISYGLYVVTSISRDNRPNGQIADVVFQACSEPPLVGICINQQNLTNKYIGESSVFAISILAQATDMKFIGHFGFKSGRDFDKFAGIKYKTGITRAPIVLDNALAYIEAEVLSRMDAGTHTIFLGKVAAAEVLVSGEPMTYAYYREIKKGLLPKNAPGYIKEETSKQGRPTMKYRCTVCGYIYEPEKGDPDSGIKPGTSFELLPGDWVCPVCGAGKDKFEPVK